MSFLKEKHITAWTVLNLIYILFIGFMIGRSILHNEIMMAVFYLVLLIIWFVADIFSEAVLTNSRLSAIERRLSDIEEKITPNDYWVGHTPSEDEMKELLSDSPKTEAEKIDSALDKLDKILDKAETVKGEPKSSEASLEEAVRKKDSEDTKSLMKDLRGSSENETTEKMTKN